MITLRDNQVEPIRKAIDFFNEAKPQPSLIVLPTAWGKSILTAYVDAGRAIPVTVMPFGKYKGEKLTDIPVSYREWMLRSFEWNARNEPLRKSIVATINQ